MSQSERKWDLIKRTKRPRPPPLLLLIRHAEAYHNATDKYRRPIDPLRLTLQRQFGLRDPVLTPEGIEQCKRLRHFLMSEEVLGQRIDMIVASPMRRALQTALLTLDFIIDRGVKVNPDSRWQETSNRPCDVGTEIIRLAPQFPSINFFDMDPIWPQKTGEYAYRKDVVVKRAQKALGDLYDRKEKVIAVVSHGHFLRTVVANKEFYNADLRIFAMKKSENDGIYLVERSRTITDGGYLGRDNSAWRGIEERDFPQEAASRSKSVPAPRTGRISAGSSTPVPSNKRITQVGKPRRVLPPLYWATRASADNREKEFIPSKLKNHVTTAAQFRMSDEAESSRKSEAAPLRQTRDSSGNSSTFGSESTDSRLSLHWQYGDFQWPIQAPLTVEETEDASGDEEP